jgi:hypothetical protein
MAADHFPSPPAFYANDVIALNGSPDRHCWSSFDDGFCSRLADVGERLMNRRNQGVDLLGRHLVASQIGADDLYSEVSRLADVVGDSSSILVSLSDRQHTISGKSRQ